MLANGAPGAGRLLLCELQHIPYGERDRSFGLKSFSSDEADAVLSSVLEQAEWIRKGSLRPLAVVESEGFEISGYGIVPSASDLFPGLARMRVCQFYGFALPADTPDGINLAPLGVSNRRFSPRWANMVLLHSDIQLVPSLLSDKGNLSPQPDGYRFDSVLLNSNHLVRHVSHFRIL